MIPLATIFTDSGLAAFTMVLVSVFKLIFEQTGLVPTTAKWHDSAIIALNLLLATGAAFLWASAQHVDLGANWQALVAQSVLQFGGSLGMYKGATKLGGSVNQSTADLINATGGGPTPPPDLPPATPASSAIPTSLPAAA